MYDKNGAARFPFDLSKPLTKEQAEAIYRMGKEAVIFVLMALTKAVVKTGSAADHGAHQPSGAIPPYEKPAIRKRRKHPGAKPGHQGSHRLLPQITHRQAHPPLAVCPECGGPLGQAAETRTRIIEDIGEANPEITEHTIPRHWCSHCQKLVEPPVPDALPGAVFGHRLIALVAWLHYGLGVTISQIRDVLQHHLHFHISAGGLQDAWRRIAKILYPWYEAIGREVKTAGVLHADETGWRVNGQTHWLWCFSTTAATYYMIDNSRGSPALSRFFTEAFDGILVSDFWSAYDAVDCAERQVCFAHLFRELKHLDEKTGSPSWVDYSKKLRRLLNDAVRLSGRREMTPTEFISRRDRIEARLAELVGEDWHDADARRLNKRLARYLDDIFTFLYHPQTPITNNHAEREIRPAVIMRKNQLCNRSRDGANTQAVLMSVYRTLKMRGLDPLETITAALKTYVATGSLPPLPDKISSDD